MIQVARATRTISRNRIVYADGRWKPRFAGVAVSAGSAGGASSTGGFAAVTLASLLSHLCGRRRRGLGLRLRCNRRRFRVATRAGLGQPLDAEARKAVDQ